MNGCYTFPKAPTSLWNFTIRLFRVISRTIVVGGGVLTFCRNAVGVFYSPRQQGKQWDASEWTSVQHENYIHTNIHQVMLETKAFTSLKIKKVDDWMSETQIKFWSFKRSQESVERDPHPGRPSKSRTLENIEGNWQLTLQKYKILSGKCISATHSSYLVCKVFGKISQVFQSSYNPYLTLYKRQEILDHERDFRPWKRLRRTKSKSWLLSWNKTLDTFLQSERDNEISV